MSSVRTELERWRRLTDAVVGAAVRGDFFFAVILLGQIQIVRSTHESNIFGASISASSERVVVVELE